MPRYSRSSRNQLATCDKGLQDLFNEVIKTFDCTIIEGHRNQVEQDEAYYGGHSQLRWPLGKHNAYPSRAVDVIPYPIDWEDRERMSFFAGYVLATARAKGIDIRWGGDWDSDTQLKDNSFDDLVHFELVP